MVNVQAFVDASGSERDRGPNAVMTVCAAIGMWDLWGPATQEWHDALKLADLETFHASEMAKLEVAKRDKLMAELTRIIHQYQIRRLSLSIQLEDFRAVDADYCLSERVGGPYGMCACLVLEGVRAMLARFSPHVNGLLTVVEDGDNGQKKPLGKWSDANPWANLHFQSKKYTRLDGRISFRHHFEVSDLHAYEWAKRVKDKTDHPERERAVFKALSSQDPNVWMPPSDRAALANMHHHLTQSELRSMCDGTPVERRM